MAIPKTILDHPVDTPLGYYLEGASLRDIAERCTKEGLPGCSLRSLARRSRAESWPVLRAACHRQAAEEMGEKLAGGNKAGNSAGNTATHGNTGGGGEAGTATPPEPATTMAARTAARTLEELAKEQAERHLPAFQQLSAAWEQAAAAAQLLVSRATMAIMAHRYEVYGSGEVDDVTGDRGLVLRDPEQKPINLGMLIQAGTLLQIGQSVAHRAVTGNPVEALRLAQAGLRKADADAEFMERRVEGTLPPEKHEHMKPDEDRFTDWLRARLGHDRQGAGHVPRATNTDDSGKTH